MTHPDDTAQEATMTETTDDRTRVVNGEVRHYGTNTCDDCGTGLILPGWLCYGCDSDRGLR